MVRGNVFSCEVKAWPMVIIDRKHNSAKCNLFQRRCVVCVCRCSLCVCVCVRALND